MPLNQLASLGQARSVAIGVELAAQQGRGLVVAECRKRHIQGIGHHSLLDVWIHHLREHVAIDGVALSHECETIRQGCDAVVDLHQLAANALNAIIPGVDGVEQLLVSDGGQVGRNRDAKGVVQLLHLGQRHVVGFADEKGDDLLDGVPLGPKIRRDQLVQSQHVLDLAADEHTLARGIDIDQAQFGTTEPHHGAEILGHGSPIVVVASGRELREVNHAIRSEQGHSVHACGDGCLVDEGLHLRVDAGRLGVEQPRRDPEQQPQIMAGIVAHGGRRQAGPQPRQQLLQGDGQVAAFDSQQNFVVRTVERIEDRIS